MTHPIKDWQHPKCSFNPHTHEGCDAENKQSVTFSLVSIHTPTKGVTFRRYKDFYSHLVSIHTPTKGVTTHSAHDIGVMVVSIHTPTKGVTVLSIIHVRLYRVSIHTPTKGVTSVCGQLPCQSLSFNPHTHEGCDEHRRLYIIVLSVSIHTPTKGVTVTACGMSSDEIVSIHTPTKGVTSVSCITIHVEAFQSTHPRRVWHMG